MALQYSAVPVEHKGEGVYTASFTLRQTGPFKVTVGLEGIPGCRAFDSICRAGPLSVPHCKVLDFDSSLTAGQTGQLRLQRRDR